MMVAPLTGLSHWLSAPQRVAGLRDIADQWRDQEVVVTLAPVARADAGLGAHLRRSFLGALAPAASAAARSGQPCPWDPPCALDVFLREQLRAGGDGLPKPYVLFWRQEAQVLTVTLRVFGTACDWFPAAAEALVAGLTGILPWEKCLPGQAAAPRIVDRGLMPPVPLSDLAPDLLSGPLTLRLDSPMDDEGANPNSARDIAALLLSRAVRRVDALARWQGLALADDASRALTEAAHAVVATGNRLSRQNRDSPNRHGETRVTRVLTGEVDLPPLPGDLRLLLALASRCHLGRHTNEGLGAISLHKVADVAGARAGIAGR